MKCLFVISSLAAGGAQRVVVDLTARLANAGHEIALITYSNPAHDHFQTPSRVKRITLSLLWDSHGVFETVRSSFSRVSILRRAIREVDPDVIVSFIDLTNILTLVSAIGLRIPVLVSERVHPRFHGIPVQWRIARRLVYPLCNALVVQTSEIARWAKRVTIPSRVYVIPNAIPDRVWVTDSVREPIVLAVGRLHRQKGFDLLIDAFSESRLPEPWRLVILGSGPEGPALQKQALQRAISERVSFPGEVHDPERWMARASFLVLSSRFEGFPNVLLEAIGARAPIVAFDCPTGPADLLAYGGGILVKNGDVAALARAIARMANDAKLREELVEQGRAARDAFSQEKVMARWLNVLTAVSGARGRSSSN